VSSTALERTKVSDDFQSLFAVIRLAEQILDVGIPVAWLGCGVVGVGRSGCALLAELRRWRAGSSGFTG